LKSALLALPSLSCTALQQLITAASLQQLITAASLIMLVTKVT
jgi:hypothetical protein